ncbi:transposase [Azospirillum brasilense]|nr:transposase [Azospirillum argentinense]
MFSIAHLPPPNCRAADVGPTGKLHVDDTPVPVLAPGAGKTRTGRLWVYARDDRACGDAAAPAALYRYTPDRKGEHPQRQLAGWRGALQADGYAGFNALYEARGGDPPAIIEVACWAHVRRKFFDIHQAHKGAAAKEVLERIGRLYAVEGPVSPAASARIHPVLRSGPSSPSRNAPADAAVPACKNSGRSRALAPRNSSDHSPSRSSTATPDMATSQSPDQQAGGRFIATVILP